MVSVYSCAAHRELTSTVTAPTPHQKMDDPPDPPPRFNIKPSLGSDFVPRICFIKKAKENICLRQCEMISNKDSIADRTRNKIVELKNSTILPPPPLLVIE